MLYAALQAASNTYVDSAILLLATNRMHFASRRDEHQTTDLENIENSPRQSKLFDSKVIAAEATATSIMILDVYTQYHDANVSADESIITFSIVLCPLKFL
jgi:hypothetical protein